MKGCCISLPVMTAIREYPYDLAMQPIIIFCFFCYFDMTEGIPKCEKYTLFRDKMQATFIQDASGTDDIRINLMYAI